MAPPTARREPRVAPLRGELRYGFELVRLLADREFVRPARGERPPVLLVPGFMAGDQSLALLAGWLRRRGSRTAHAGIVLNTDCGERAMRGIEERVRALAEEQGERIVLIGQSRGGEFARVAAARNPEHVRALVMLGSPVCDPLHVAPSVMSALKNVARLGGLGLPGMLSMKCADGRCCADYRVDLDAPLAPPMRAVSIYSRSDGIVSWEACLDPYAEHVEVDSSHTGMSVNARVYRVIAAVLDDEEVPAWTG